jgi:hypothetical protein
MLGDIREEWKPIPSLDDCFEASSHGRIRRVKGNLGSNIGLIIRPHLNSSGYQLVYITLNGYRRKYRVHRLVAEAFLGPRPPGKQVNHIDGVKANNARSNLEYVTAKENMRHAMRLGLIRTAGLSIRNFRNEDKLWRKLSIRSVKHIRENPDNLTGVALGKQFGVDHCTVSRIRSGKMWKHLLD